MIYFDCGIPHAFINKGLKPGFRDSAKSHFPTERHNALTLSAIIADGDAFSLASFQDGNRKTAQFISGQLVGLDLDKGVSVAQALAHPDVKKHAAIVYPTASHTPEYPKTRVVFVLDSPIAGEGAAVRFETVLRALLSHFDCLMPDRACKDAARFFYGSTQPGMVVNEAAILPLEVVRSWVKAMPADPPAPVERRTRPAFHQTADNDYNDLAAALFCIPPNGIDFPTWQGVFAGVTHALGASAALPLLEQWTGYCSKPGEVPYRVNSFENDGQYDKRKAGKGTVFHIAKQFGYDPRRNRPARTPQPAPEPASQDEPRHRQAIEYQNQYLHTLSEPENQPSRWFPQGLPDTWRTDLLNISQDAALTAELMTCALNAGQLAPDSITEPALKKAREICGFGPKDSTLHAGFKVLHKLLLREVAEVFSENQPYNNNNIGCKSRKNPSTGGRPVKTYALLPLSEQRANLDRDRNPRLTEDCYPTHSSAFQEAIAGEFVTLEGHELDTSEDSAALLEEVNRARDDHFTAQAALRAAANRKMNRRAGFLKLALQDSASSPLPNGWPVSNPKEYRVAYLRALKTAGKLQEHEPKWKISALLGLSTSVVNDYLTAAGIEIEKDQTTTRRITSPENVTVQVLNCAREVGGFPKHVFIDGDKRGYSEEMAYKTIPESLAAGQIVEVEYQIANRHTLIEDAQPQEKPAPAPVERHTSELRPATSPPALRIVEPRPIYGHSSEWLQGQLELTLQFRGWVRDNGRLVQSETGEIAPESPTLHDLLELVIGRPIARKSKPRTAEEMRRAGWSARDIQADFAAWGIAS